MRASTYCCRMVGACGQVDRRQAEGEGVRKEKRRTGMLKGMLEFARVVLCMHAVEREAMDVRL